MANEQNIPREITHPETGARMVLVDEQTSGTRRARFTDREYGNPETGRRQIELLEQKEREHGYLYRDPVTGYQHRMKPEGVAERGPRQDAASGASGAASQGAGQDSAGERERLVARLRELDAANA